VEGRGRGREREIGGGEHRWWKGEGDSGGGVGWGGGNRERACTTVRLWKRIQLVQLTSGLAASEAISWSFNAMH
jgi:hypothetical protein